MLDRSHAAAIVGALTLLLSTHPLLANNADGAAPAGTYVLSEGSPVAPPADLPLDQERTPRIRQAAGELLTNGGFEDGGTGWSVVTFDGSSGQWSLYTGTTAPLSGSAIPPPAEGEFAAVTDQTGPGAYVLYQDVAIPAEGARLSCQFFAQTASTGGFVTPATLDPFGQFANQQARIDIYDPGADVTSATAGVLQNLFITRPGTANITQFTTLVADLNRFAGRTIRLRFAEADNQGFFQLGVDDCSIVATGTPTPGEPVVEEEIAIVPPSVRPQNVRTVYAPDGRKAVIWQQNGTGGTIICIQFFDADDVALTTPLIVNQSQGANRNPTGAFTATGAFFLYWVRDDGVFTIDPDGKVTMLSSAGTGIQGRGFSSSGQPSTNEMSVGSGDLPESDSDRSGDQVLTWNEDGVVVGQVFDQNGNPKSGVFQVDDTDGGEGQTVARSPNGATVVVWEQRKGARQGIKVRRYQQGGGPRGPAQVVTSATTANHPAVAMDGAGNFVVVWEGAGVGRDVFAQRYAASGATLGSSFRVNANRTGDQTNPRVDVNDEGDFVIAWQSTSVAATGAATAASTGIQGRSFSSDGTAREESDVTLAEPTGGNGAEKPDVTINGDDDVTVVFERRDSGGTSQGIFRKEVDFSPPAGTCTPSATELCLNEGRFRVSVLWENAQGELSNGQAVSLTSDTGYFWFFGPENVEVVAKVLSGCIFNGNFWFGAAGLTDVEVTVRVDDVISGQSVTYFNPTASAFQPILDTSAFPTCDLPAAQTPLTDEELSTLAAGLMAELELDVAPLADLEEIGDLSIGAACTPDADTLCLNGGRFAVDVTFDTPQGASGVGQQQPITGDTGYFSFFDPANVEIVVKVLDACSFNNRFWVFAGGLTDVRATLRVRDTQTGRVKRYNNQLGVPFQPIRDTSAFRGCN